MNVTGKFNVEGKEYLSLQLDEVAIPITAACLASSAIFDDLKAEGWVLTGIDPVVLEKDGVSTDNLPEVPALEVGQDEIDRINALEAECYDASALKLFLGKEGVDYIEFKPVKEIVKTREEFLALLALEERKRDEEEVHSVLPYATFVAQSALPTVEEYFSDEWSRWRRVMQKHRTMTLRGYALMVKALKGFGLLKDGYDEEDLVKALFSCGFDFRAENVLSITTQPTQTILGTRAGANLASAAVTERSWGMLTATGEVRKLPGKEGFTCQLSAQAREAEIAKLNKLGANFCMPVQISGNTSVPLTTVTSEKFTAQFTPGAYRTTYNGKTETYSPLSVSVGGGLHTLRTELLLLDREESQRALLEELVASECVNTIVKNTTVRTNGSSYTALLASGSGEVGAFMNFIKNGESGASIAAELGCVRITQGKKEAKSTVDFDACTKLIEKYLHGELDESSPEYFACSNELQDIVDGVYNIGDIAMGMRLDRAINHTEFLGMFICAMRFLGISPSALAQKVLALTPKETGNLVLEGNGYAIAVPITRRDCAYRYYKETLRKEQLRAAKEAQQVHYVEFVMRELCGKSYVPSTRHTGVVLLSFYVGNPKVAKCRTRIRKALESRIDEYIPPVQRDDAKLTLDHDSANGLFSVALTGKINLPDSLGGPLTFGDDLVATLKKEIHRTMESTVSMTRYGVQINGAYYHYCVNAVILSTFVVPRPGCTLREVPFMPLWTDCRLVARENPNIIPMYIEKGYIPNDPEFRGLGYLYNRPDSSLGKHEYPVATNNHSTNIEFDRTALTNYVARAEHHRTTVPLTADMYPPTHPAEYNFPLLYGEEGALRDALPTGSLGFPRTPGKEGKPHGWVNTAPIRYTREDIFARCPWVKALYQPMIVAHKDKEIEEYTGLKLEDLRFVDSLSDIDLAPTFGNTIRALGVIQNRYVVFTDSVKRYTTLDIAELDQTKYAVRQLAGRAFLVLDVNGRVWRCQA